MAKMVYSLEEAPCGSTGFFTEQGVAMLSGVLKSERAVSVNIDK